MSASGVAGVPVPPPHALGRARATLAAVGAVVLGAAPHVLHHGGPLAGAALLVVRCLVGRPGKAMSYCATTCGLGRRLPGREILRP